MNEPIVTPRLRLARIEERDGERLAALLTNDEVARTYMVPPIGTDEAKAAMCARFYALSADDGRFVYGIFLNGRLIGLMHEVDRSGSEMELGYVIDPAEKGRGYASEALSAAVNKLFALGFSVVKAGAFSENAASLRVMEKCGMLRTQERETVTYRGGEHECVFCEIRAPKD